MLIRLGWWRKDWERGIKIPVLWNTASSPHLLVSGITGGGKTVLAQTVVNQLLNTNARLSIADYKADGDWSNIVADYGEYLQCDEIVETFYQSFMEAIQSKRHENRFLLFDEFSSYALSKDSKDYKNLMSKISHIAFMGRSFGFHLILISQQFNAKVLDTAIREQFGVKIYMGSTISTESATMLFPNSEIDKSKHLSRCCGYISMPEKEIGVIQIPYIQEPNKLKKLLEIKGNTK